MILKLPTAVYWTPSLLWKFRQLGLAVGSLVTTTNLRCVKSPQCECLNITEVSTPTSDVPHYVQCTGSQLSLNASPMFVASYLLSSLHRTLIFIERPSPAAIKTIANEDRFALPNQAPYQHLLMTFPPHSATPSLACFSHHNRTNELATSDRFTSVSPPVFFLFQHYILISYQFQGR